MLSQKPSAAQKRLERDRMRKAGYVLHQFWVRPEHWPRVRKYLTRVTKP